MFDICYLYLIFVFNDWYLLVLCILIYIQPGSDSGAQLLIQLSLRPKRPANQFVPRLYGFKIHPLAYQIQQQAAANFKVSFLRNQII